nr:MAG TPA: hypothetical protein [Caudoviricetes sp.]
MDRSPWQRFYMEDSHYNVSEAMHYLHFQSLRYFNFVTL